MEEKELIKVENESMQVFNSKENFELAQRMSKLLASSSLVPQQFKGNEANCVIAIEMANRMNLPPLMVMQNLYVVHGNPGWSSKFLIAAINTSGKISTPLRYEFKGEEGSDNWGCRAWAIDSTGERLNGSWVDIKMAKDEGWYTKNGSKWKTMPQLMLQYRAAAFFVRTYAPEISMGFQTKEEFEDIKVVDTPYIDVIDQNTIIDISEIKTLEEANDALLKGSISKEDYSVIEARLNNQAETLFPDEQ